MQIVPDVTLPDQWEELTGDPLGGSHGDPTAFFIEHLRKDVRNFADRLPRFLNGMLQSADTYVKVQQARNLLLSRMLTQLFNQCDVVLTTETGAFDGTGIPLMCMPIGFDTDDDSGRRVPPRKPSCVPDLDGLDRSGISVAAPCPKFTIYFDRSRKCSRLNSVVRQAWPDPLGAPGESR